MHVHSHHPAVGRLKHEFTVHENQPANEIDDATPCTLCGMDRAFHKLSKADYSGSLENLVAFLRAADERSDEERQAAETERDPDVRAQLLTPRSRTIDVEDVEALAAELGARPEKKTPTKARLTHADVGAASADDVEELRDVVRSLVSRVEDLEGENAELRAALEPGQPAETKPTKPK